MNKITKIETLVFTTEESGQIGIKFTNSQNVAQTVKHNDELIVDKQANGDRTMYITTEKGDKIYLWAEEDGSEYEIIK